VAYVERDSRVWINDQFHNPTTVPVAENVAQPASEQIDVEYGAPWGLARISHRHKLKFSTFNVYPFEDPAGLGVDAYVIDTSVFLFFYSISVLPSLLILSHAYLDLRLHSGVNIEHEELEGRAKWGKTIPDDVDIDSNGHGSHVAGTIASRTYGVAKNATIIAVKVLGAGGKQLTFFLLDT
jgi:cerevisin